MRISEIRCPEYTDDFNDFDKWRLCYKGGRHFIQRYLKQFSKRETDGDFQYRKDLTYAPTFAKMGLTKIKNTLYSRMSEIRRIGGPQSYQEAILGKEGGVNLYGASMNTFIGQEVVEEMMVMKRVGVFVDRPGFDDNLLANNTKKKPYLYAYKTEDILSWTFTYAEGELIYTDLLLRDYTVNLVDGLRNGVGEQYRHLTLMEDGRTRIRLYQEVVEPTTGKPEEQLVKEVFLDMPRLPFVMFELRESLMIDVADYQIALLNLVSSDMNYCHKANTVFYVEQRDPASESPYMRGTRFDPATGETIDAKDTAAGTGSNARSASNANEIQHGSLAGRSYARGLNEPNFIAPPSDPLRASMLKQEQMKNEIFQLLDIAVSTAMPTHASAESKAMDDRSVESGLSYIGLELEYGEREIAKIWALYENQQPATVQYPVKYSLKSDADRLANAKALDGIKSSVPSKQYAKQIAKQITREMLADKVEPEVIVKIDKEIDAAKYISSDPDLIKTASELGMVCAATGSEALGFDGEEEAKKAQEEHTKRLAEIQKAQTSQKTASGVNDTQVKNGKDIQTEPDPAATA